MSQQALSGTVTYIEAHRFEFQQEAKMTVVGVGDSSAVSTMNRTGEWQHIMKPKDSERISVTIPAGGQVFAVRVNIMFEEIGEELGK